jgi:RNA polymerase sigma-70 factor (ECF subfamily)
MPSNIFQTEVSAASDRWERDNIRYRLLIARAQAGDVEAFDQLYVSTMHWLLACIRRIVDDGQAEDVLAEVYIQVWRSLSAYDETRAVPSAWLAMIARSRALDHLRREHHRGGQGSADRNGDEVIGGEGPEELLTRSQEARLLRLSLAALDPHERLVLGLAYFRECTQPEIAAMTGLTLGMVKSVASRAQHKLRTHFATRMLPARTASSAAQPSP